MPIVLPGGESPAPSGATTAADLIRELASRMGDYAEGTLTHVTGDTISVRDATRFEQSNTYKYGWFYYHGGAATSNIGRELRITAYDGLEGGTAQVGHFTFGGGTLLVQGSVGDQYQVNWHWSRERKLAALNAAIRMLPIFFWRRVEDLSTTTTTGTTLYPCPPAIQEVLGIEVLRERDEPGEDAAGYGWSVRNAVQSGGSVTRTIAFRNAPPPDHFLRIVGKGILPPFSQASDVVTVGADDRDGQMVEYLLAVAIQRLWMWGANGAPVKDVKRILELVQVARNDANDLRPQLLMSHPPRRSITPWAAPTLGWRRNGDYLAAHSTPGPM
jgi:hypothetical protein